MPRDPIGSNKQSPAGSLCLLLDLLVVELGQDVGEVGVVVGQTIKGGRCISSHYLAPGGIFSNIYQAIY